MPFLITDNGISGIWMLKNRITFLCTATSSRGLEKILHQIVETPVVMKFPSEYELIHKVSPVEGATIKPCENKEEML